MLQVIDAVLKNPDDNTQVRIVLFCCMSLFLLCLISDYSLDVANNYIIRAFSSYMRWSSSKNIAVCVSLCGK